MRVRLNNIDGRPTWLPIHEPEGVIELNGTPQIGYLLKDKFYIEMDGHANYNVIVEIPMTELRELLAVWEKGTAA